MVAALWTDEQTRLSLQHWREYQATHDIEEHLGQTAGIDPHTGQVWFGASAGEIAELLESDGRATPLYFVRVGSDYYLRKGSRR